MSQRPPAGRTLATSLRFIAGGAFNTVASLLVYWALLPWLSPLAAYAVAFAAGVVLGYFVNAWFVFHARPSWRGLASWPLVPFAGWLVGAAVLLVATGPLGIDPRLAPLLSIPATVPVTWLLARRLLRHGRALAPPPPPR